MMRTTLAAALLLGATGALAQAAPEVPKHKCEPKPVMPGQAMRADASVMRGLNRDIDAYRKCMREYADERAAASKAHTDAGNAAINEYNATMQALQDAQKR